MAEIKQSKRGGARPNAGRKPKPKTPKGKPLKNEQHEKFAQALAEGKSKTQAYTEAGYSPHASNASRLSEHDKVKARVAELKQAIVASVIARTSASKEYVLEALIDTLERCRQAAPVLDRKGEIVMVETATGELVPAYIFDAKNVLRSAELIGKEIGMFKQEVVHSGSIGRAGDLTDAELADIAAGRSEGIDPATRGPQGPDSVH
jgi:phage terminase small subunit